MYGVPGLSPVVRQLFRALSSLYFCSAKTTQRRQRGGLILKYTRAAVTRPTGLQKSTFVSDLIPFRLPFAALSVPLYQPYGAHAAVARTRYVSVCNVGCVFTLPDSSCVSGPCLNYLVSSRIVDVTPLLTSG